MKVLPGIEKLAFLICLFSAALATCTVCAQSTKETVVYSTGLPKLSQSQIASLHHDALNGSASAAKTLALRSGLGAGDVKGEIFWYSVEVENGDISARRSLAMALTADDDPDSSTRARYWFNRIISSGSSSNDVKCAQSGLEELALVESMRKKHP